MGSNRLPFGLILGRQQTNSCIEQYHWQQLTLRQREHATREQSHCGSTLNHPPYTYSRDRVEDSVTATDISCQSRGYHDTVNNICYSRSETDFNNWNQPLDQPDLLELKQYRRSTSPRCGVNRTGESSTFYDHEHYSEIPYPEKGIGAPHHLSCSYSHLFENMIGGYHGQGQTYHSHSSKRFRRSFSPGPAPTSSYRTERSPSFVRVHDYAKGTNGHMHITVSHEEVFPFNHGSSTRDRHYQEDQNLPTKVDFPGGHFSEIDEARHRSYMDFFRIYKKHESHSWEDPTVNISDHISAGQSHHWDELGGAHTKKASDEFNAIHHEQYEPKGGFQENNSNGACASKHGRNSRWKRYGGHLAELKAKNMAYEDQSKGFCYLKEQYQKPYLHDEVHNDGSDVMRNDNREGNAATSKEVGQNGPKVNFHPKKNILTAATCSGSTKSNENSDVLSPKYSSKTIASSNVPKQNEGSSNMKLESDKWPSDDGCTKSTQNMTNEEASRGNLQHPPVTHMEKGVHTKESDNISSAELLRDCLSLWRRLRKDNGAEAEKVMQTHKIGTVETSRVSIGGRVRTGRAASASSESDDENDSASRSVFGSSESDDESDSAFENSEQRRKTMSYSVRKRGEGSAKRKSEQPFRCLSGSNRNKSLQNTMAEQGLKCNLKFPPEANPSEITQQKEQDKLSCCQLSAAHPDAKIQTSRNSCSDNSKVDQAAASHPDSSVCQKVSQHEATNDHLDARRKYKLDVSCEIKKKVQGNGVKWAEQMASSSTGPTLLDQKNVALCSMHDDSLKVNELVCPNQDSKSTSTFSAPKFDKGTANNCEKKPVNWSSESAYRDIQNLSKGNDCRDIQWDTLNCNILKNKQEFSALADSENNIRQTEKDYEPPQALEVPSNQQISHQLDSDRTNSGVARRADWTSCCGIPDLNSLPSMDRNEESKASEEGIYQISGDGSKPQDASKRLSAPISGPTLKEELFKQPEPNELIGGISEREGANRLPISNSHSGLPQVSTVEGSSASIDAFKYALCEFIKNILKPLWEDGLLSREVHKIIVKKAVEKVTVVLGPKIPLTEIAICRFLSEKSQSVEKLVEGYLYVYLGRQVLKRTMPDNS